MKNKIKQLVIPLSILLFSASTYGSTELGEFCFSGTFPNLGHCDARLEITQHIVNFSVNGKIKCDDPVPAGPLPFISDSLSGIVNGTGHIEGNDFVGALSSVSELGEVGISPSIITNNASTIKINLSTLEATFRLTRVDAENCTSDPTFSTLCNIEAVFPSTPCPTN